MIGEDPLHPAFVALEVGDWIEFATPSFHKIGQVKQKSGKSLLVLWQAAALPNGLPDAEMYFRDADQPSRHTTMRVIPPQSRIPHPSGRVMSVSQAAATLNTTRKAVRQMLRDGQLIGSQKGGRWIAVKIP